MWRSHRINRSAPGTWRQQAWLPFGSTRVVSAKNLFVKKTYSLPLPDLKERYRQCSSERRGTRSSESLSVLFTCLNALSRTTSFAYRKLRDSNSRTSFFPKYLPGIFPLAGHDLYYFNSLIVCILCFQQAASESYGKSKRENNPVKQFMEINREKVSAQMFASQLRPLLPSSGCSSIQRGQISKEPGRL